MSPARVSADGWRNARAPPDDDSSARDDDDEEAERRGDDRERAAAGLPPSQKPSRRMTWTRSSGRTASFDDIYICIDSIHCSTN
jgi:hypothetical protein